MDWRSYLQSEMKIQDLRQVPVLNVFYLFHSTLSVLLDVAGCGSTKELLSMYEDHASRVECPIPTQENTGSVFSN